MDAMLKTDNHPKTGNVNIKTLQFTKTCKDDLQKQQISQKMMLLLQHSDFLAM